MPAQQRRRRRRRLLFVTRESVYMSNATPEHTFCNFHFSRVFFRLSIRSTSAVQSETFTCIRTVLKNAHFSDTWKNIESKWCLGPKESVWYDSRYHSTQPFFHGYNQQNVSKHFTSFIRIFHSLHTFQRQVVGMLRLDSDTRTSSANTTVCPVS